MCNYKTDTVELKKIMVEKHIDTITQLSELSGVGRDTLSKILSGKAQPSAGVMIKLSSALEMNPEVAGKIFFTPNLRNT